jgi:hypothetical protein
MLEALLRYYDLLSYTEAMPETKKSEKRVIGLAKQKLLLYLGFTKTVRVEETYDVKSFLDVYYNQ